MKLLILKQLKISKVSNDFCRVRGRRGAGERRQQLGSVRVMVGGEDSTTEAGSSKGGDEVYVSGRHMRCGQCLPLMKEEEGRERKQWNTIRWLKAKWQEL